MKSIIEKQKLEELNIIADYRDKLYKNPKLRFLFLELTLSCNEHCIHCGSRAGDVVYKKISKEDYKRVLDDVKENFGTKGMMLNITGGEPLLSPDFFEIMNYAKDLGFGWGMTSNGILIDDKMAEKLYQAGMKTISISIDGLEETHDWFRQTKGGYKMAMDGVKALVNNGKFEHVQISTVVHKKNINEIEELYKIMEGIDIDSWRLIGIEPIGRALDNPELLLDGKDFKYIFDFIKEKRANGEPVTYGCSHYLGLDYERDVRDWYYLCNAGVYAASVMANGDIGPCLDCDRNAITIQGNVLVDKFSDVWKNKFEVFRTDKSVGDSKCVNCSSRRFCNGGACHTWDFEQKRQRVCIFNELEELKHEKR